MPKLMIVAAVALVDRDGRVLLSQRPEGKPLAGMWEFPGGKVEEGETPEEALVRELAEEIGIETQASCLAPVTFASEPQDEVHLLMLVFACRKWSGIPQPLENQGLRWFRPNRFHELDLVPADRPVAAQLRDLLGG
ncbi:(deoxy)nucleoside triphosphate pyrophosphohydrolase [Parvularcula oceani]|uniref:(deoxy)nucleoside triphosphate pyrophosphohydrolase n=1 Tax=Parvularcula oceani TaxID=1247963 RepID=UPI0004E122C9|nr:(deoxy)nucleoside triphosphate pyrophosphohydrolase [Parvularcula oceani]